MKKKDLLALRKESVEEIEKLTLKKRLELASARADIMAGGQKDLKKAKKIKKEISQAMTILKEVRLVKQKETVK